MFILFTLTHTQCQLAACRQPSLVLWMALA
uniref:Uncharacterized protein n=1 Tax=Arundo donax TaxID=35708 RepID=A0A0A9D3M2_ARUDO